MKKWTIFVVIALSTLSAFSVTVYLDKLKAQWVLEEERTNTVFDAGEIVWVTNSIPPALYLGDGMTAGGIRIGYADALKIGRTNSVESGSRHTVLDMPADGGHTFELCCSTNARAGMVIQRQDGRGKALIESVSNAEPCSGSLQGYGFRMANREKTDLFTELLVHESDVGAVRNGSYAGVGLWVGYFRGKQADAVCLFSTNYPAYTNQWVVNYPLVAGKTGTTLADTEAYAALAYGHIQVSAATNAPSARKGRIYVDDADPQECVFKFYDGDEWQEFAPADRCVRVYTNTVPESSTDDAPDGTWVKLDSSYLYITTGEATNKWKRVPLSTF